MGKTGVLATSALFGSVLAVLVGVLTACGSTVSGTATAAGESGLVNAVPTSNGEAPSDTELPDATPSTDVQFSAAIGDCLSVTGTKQSAEVDHATCGSPESNYKVIAKAPTPSGCIADADLTYTAKTADAVEGTLCLDVDWVVGGCVDVSKSIVTRVDCSKPSSDTVRITAIQHGTTSGSACPNPDGRVFAHRQRNFVVCADDI